MINELQRAVLRLVWEGVGPSRIKQLVEECGSPEAAVAAGPRAWWAGSRLAGRQTPPPLTLDQELALVERHGAGLVTLADPGYPAPLRSLPDPPPILYSYGNWLPEDAAAVAIVGSRLASTHGLAIAERLAHDLASHGLTVVSGLARGIDAAGHRGALRAGGRTIAVLGHGLTHMFPAEHADLAKQIAGQGVVLSEFPMTTESFKANFPRRNRLISGLTLGVIVVEAASHSGALITANFAAEQGREVFAVPGLAGQPTSRGTHQLLRDGATLVESAEDVLAELGPMLKQCLATLRGATHLGSMATAPPPRLTAHEAQVYARLTPQPVAVDELAGSTGVPAPELLRVLLRMELRGLVRQIPGQQFVRVAS